MSENYHAYGEVYNVAEKQKEYFGKSLTNDESWFEYRVFLKNSKGKIVAEWDSLYETYNGVKGQRLSKSKAQSAIDEIKEDINEKGEDPSLWFNI